jgi:hypothetical protein
LSVFGIIYTERNKGQKEYPVTSEKKKEKKKIDEVPTPEDTQAAVEDYVFWREAIEGVK